MSEQKLISPLLDGFLIGDPISDHDGVRCCPAMRKENEDKYIVKIISIPSSQRQLDALLLTGAYPNAASAMDYFREQAEGVVKEAEILKNLSSLQGFFPYENWQTESMGKNMLGYEVYLLSPFKRSLEKYLKSNTMTHIGAVNLGIQLCEALSICRRAGYMYVALKPGNIFLDSNQEFRIGDLGFASLSSMKFSSMPGKYRSEYTPPELHDDLVTLNPTADIYSVGMILYQIYNNGKLPFTGKAPNTALDAPLNADYEMAEIILKAIAPNPRDRWQTPIEMGQELAAYLTRNGVNDSPILAPGSDTGLATDGAPEVSEKSDDRDETVPDIQDSENAAAITGETSDMLAQADELLSMELPELVVVPEAPDVASLDELIREEFRSENAPAIAQPSDEEGKSEFAEFTDDDQDEDVVIPPRRIRTRSWIGILILALVVTLLGYGGFRFYKDYYLLPIESISLEGSKDTVSVFVDTQVDETLLSVVCTDTYGNTMTAPLVRGGAEFIGLNPGTTYKITLEAEGFHKLSGAESCSHTTSEQTKISNFSGKTGTEDGSVILSFDLDGRDAQDWSIRYIAEGELENVISFTGHSVPITGLVVGKTYTFSLEAPSEELWIVGKTELEYTASEIVVAQDLEIISCSGGTLTAQWKTPADTVVESWTIRCYTEGGYDQTITTAENSVQFDGITANKAYTVEVTAAGMTQSTRAYVSANPATITHFSIDAPQDEYVLKIDWEFEGTTPEGGWLLLYSMDNGENRAVVSCSEASAVIAPRVPGATYHFSIQASDGSTVFNGKTSYDCVATDSFDLHGIKSSKVSASLCPTPKNENWSYKSIGKNDYTSKYAPGSNVSIVIYSDNRAKASDDSIEVMFVIRDANGNVMPELTNTLTAEWDDLWNNRSRYCELDIPAIPGVPGKYTVEVYFNQQLLVYKTLNITE